MLLMSYGSLLVQLQSYSYENLATEKEKFMQDKNKAYEQIQRTIEWNTIRGNTPDTLNWDLEISMLQEELNELSTAVLENDDVKIFDALMDLEFVLRGTASKFGLTAEMQIAGYDAVISANETKSASKNALGKITKPDNFVGPEAELQKILDSRS